MHSQIALIIVYVYVEGILLVETFINLTLTHDNCNLIGQTLQPWMQNAFSLELPIYIQVNQILDMFICIFLPPCLQCMMKRND
jgi:hypothetical protein